MRTRVRLGAGAALTWRVAPVLAGDAVRFATTRLATADATSVSAISPDARSRADRFDDVVSIGSSPRTVAT